MIRGWTLGLLTGGVLLAAMPVRGEVFESNGYTLRLAARQEAERLRVEGRIDGGAACRLLRVEVKLRNAAGGTKLVRMKVAEAGDVYSRLVEGALTVKGAPTAWEIETVAARCERR